MSDKPIPPADEPLPGSQPSADSVPNSDAAAPTPAPKPAAKRATAKKSVQRSADKPARAAKKAAPKEPKSPRTAKAPDAIRRKVEEPPAAVQPSKAEAKPAAPSAPVPLPAAEAPWAAASVVQRTPSAEPAGPPLEALARTVTSRLHRSTLALSPWTQRTLRGQTPANLAAEAAPEAAPGRALPGTAAPPEAAPLALTAPRMQSLVRQVQRQEERATHGTFGRMSNGVQRAERFAGNIAAHFPELASKYEQPAAPAAQASPAPMPPGGPSFTYYPESGASSGAGGAGGAGTGTGQPTMTAAEVLQRYGGGEANRTPATPPAPAPTPPPKPRPTRDIRTQRRFSKVEEYSSKNEAPPIAEAPSTPGELAQRRAEAAAPGSRPPAPAAKAPSPGPTDEAPRTPPAEPTPPAPAENAGPLRWDHLNNLPPSVQRQLERVQRTRAEEVGQVSAEPPVPPAEPIKPFRPRNPMPPPPPQTPPVQRAVEPPAEPPVSFGPDLTPRRAAIQRQPQTPAAQGNPPEPAATPPQPAVPPVRFTRTRPPETPVAQRAVEDQPAETAPTPPEAMPLAPVARPARSEPAPPAEDIFDTAVVNRAPAEAVVPAKPIEPEPFEAILPAAVQRTPETPARSEMPLREAPPAVQQAQPEDVQVQRAPVEPRPAATMPPAAERAERATPRPSTVPETTAARPPSAVPAAPIVQRSAERAEAREQPLTLREPVEPVGTQQPAPVQRAAAPVEDNEAPPTAAPVTELQAAPVATEPSPLEPTQPIARAIESPLEQPLIMREPAEEAQETVQRNEAVEQPLVMREPAPPAAPAAPAAPVTARTVDAPPKPLAQPAAEAPARPQPRVQREIEEPAEAVQQLLILRQLIQPPVAVEAVPEATAPELQRTPAEAEVIEPPAAPDATPEPAEPAVIQRSAAPAEMLDQPLTLREPVESSVEPIRTTASEPAEAAEPPASAAVPLIQRQAATDELPLRTPAAPPMPAQAAASRPAEPPAVARATAPEPMEPAPKPTIQRRASLDVSQEPLPLRQPAEPPSPAAQPSEPPAGAPPQIQPMRLESVSPAPEAVEPPPTPQGRIMRADDGGDGGEQLARQALPLREPPAPAPKGPAQPMAQALGDEVFERIVQGANMPRVNMTATGTRRSIQRQASESRPQLPLAEPAQPQGLARSHAGETPVLPQARVQRDADSSPAAGPAAVLTWPNVSEPAGTLPLAPPAVASASAARKVAVTTTGVQSLPLAPTIQRHEVPGEDTTTEPTVTTRPRSNAISGRNTYQPENDEDDDGDMGLVRLFDEGETIEEDIDSDSAIAPDTEVSDGINLDELADKVMPYIKRLIQIERERYRPT